MNGTWTNTKLGMIEDLKCPVDDWKGRKHFQKFVGDRRGFSWA
jgi:hypothetical protein